LLELVNAADAMTPPATPRRTAAAEPTERSLSPMTPLSSISVNARQVRKLAPRSLFTQFLRCNIENRPVKRHSSLGRAINTILFKRKLVANEKLLARAVSRATLYRYKKNQEKFKKVKSPHQKRILPGSGRKPTLPPEIENAIIEWMRSRRDRSKKVRGKSIKKQALNLVKNLGEQFKIKKFKASRGWLSGFKKRHKIRYRRITSLSRKLSDGQLNEYQKQYSQDIMKLKNTLQISESQIYNMDETPILFDTPGKFTLDFEGAKSVSVETTGNLKNRITLILCIDWKGGKLIPFIIFKSLAKNQPIIERYPTDTTKPVKAYYCGQEHATNDTKTMLAWIKCVFNNRDNSTRPCILTMDNVSFHHSNEITRALREQNVTISNFPPNTTCRLQPLDHSINGVVKNKLDEYWNEYMDRIDIPRTKAGNLQRPSKELILEWITRAFDELKPLTIINSFNSCWICEKKKDLVAAQQTPAQPRPDQTAISLAIVPTPAIAVSNELLQNTATSRPEAIPAQLLLRMAPPTIAPLMVMPLIDDDIDDSDYGDSDTDCDNNDDVDEYDDGNDGDDGDDGNDGNDGDGDDDDDGGCGDSDDDMSSGGGDDDDDNDDDGDDVDMHDHVIDESPPAKRTRRTC